MSNILEHNGRIFVIGSYAVSKALKSIGFSLSNIGEAIDTHFFELINAVIFYSAEYPAFKEGRVTDFSEADVYELLDSTGGYNGAFIQKFTKVMLESINPGEAAKETETTAKKKHSPLRRTA